MDENELIRHSKEGHLESFNKLVEVYQKQVYNLALRMLNDSQAAEDASQDAFFSAWRRIDSFRAGNFRAWLLRITTNACCDQLRMLKRHPTTSLDNLSLDPESPPSSDSPEEYALRLELGEQIKKGLAGLPSDQKLAVILHDIQGLNYEEMVQVMGCSLGTVKSRLSRGRIRLRDYLRQQGTFPS